MLVVLYLYNNVKTFYSCTLHIRCNFTWICCLCQSVRVSKTMKLNPTLLTESTCTCKNVFWFQSFQGFEVRILKQFFSAFNAEFADLEKVRGKVRGLYESLVCNIYSANVQTSFKAACFPYFSYSHVREEFYCIKSMCLLVYKYLTTIILCWFKWKEVHHILQKH